MWTGESFFAGQTHKATWFDEMVEERKETDNCAATTLSTKRGATYTETMKRREEPGGGLRMVEMLQIGF